MEKLLSVAANKSPTDVATWLYRHVNERIDEELEVLASHFLTEDFLDIAQSPEVQALLAKGRIMDGLQLALSRQRRRVAKVLRDHQRGEDDAFLDSCVQE